MSTHTLSVLVENKPGVLSHVAGLFSRRAFNISSLAVGPTARRAGQPHHDRRRRRIHAGRAGQEPARQAGPGAEGRRADRRLRGRARACADQGAGRPGAARSAAGGRGSVRRQRGRHEPDHAGARGREQPGQAGLAARHAGQLRHLRAGPDRPHRAGPRRRRDHRRDAGPVAPDDSCPSSAQSAA